MQPKARVAALLREVWNEGRVAAAAHHIAPRYTIHHDPGDPWDGQTLDLATYCSRVELSRAPFPDQQFSIAELVAENDRVVVVWHWSGTHAGEVAGIAPSGKRLRMSGMTSYRLLGGQVCGHWQICDRLSLWQQLQANARDSAVTDRDHRKA